MASLKARMAFAITLFFGMALAFLYILIFNWLNEWLGKNVWTIIVLIIIVLIGAVSGFLSAKRIFKKIM